MNPKHLRVVDTNVPKVANLALNPDPNSDVPPLCVLNCIQNIASVIETRGLVVDSSYEIFTEYRQQLSMKGQPGVGDRFMKWVHDNLQTFPEDQRVAITKNGDSYNEFPENVDLHNFDPSDKKFVAVANAHPNKPEILQATDSKWWGHKKALRKCGIAVQFLCEHYVESKYTQKI